MKCQLTLDFRQSIEDLIAGDLVSIAFADVFVCDVSVFVDDEDGSGGEAIAEEVENVVADGDVVVLVGVEDGKFCDGFSDDGFGASEVVGADGQDFGTSVRDF